MAAELRVDTIKGRSGINTFTFKGDGFFFDQKVGIGTTVASDPVLSTNAGKLSVGVVSTYSLYSDGATFSANVSIGGSLTVDGTQTIINTEELNIQDKTIGIGSTSSPTSSTQDGAGIHIFGQTRVDMLYDNNKSALGFSTSIDVTGFATFSSGIKAQDVSIAGAAATLSANGNATFSGIVTAASFVGDGSALSGISGVSLSGSTNNTVATVTGANALAGEANLTFDGTKFTVGTGATISTNGNISAGISTFAGGVTFKSNTGTNHWFFKASGALEPGYNNFFNIGDSSKQVNNIYTNNLLAGGTVTIADTIVHSGDTNTKIRFADNDTITAETAGSERIRIDSSGNFLVGKDSVYGSGKAQVHNTSQYVLDLNLWAADANPAVLAFYKSRNATPGGATVVQDDDGIGSLRFLGNDGANSREAAYIKAFVDGTPGTDDMPGRLVFGTTVDGGSSSTERLRIDKVGSVKFSNGMMIESVNITAGKLSDNLQVNLDNGVVHHFTTTETTTATPNLVSSVGINTTMATGDNMVVTIITTTAAAAYSAALKIDGSSATVKWVGGSAPSAGGSSGVDIYSYNIIKTGSGAYTVIGNLTNAA